MSRGREPVKKMYTDKNIMFLPASFYCLFSLKRPPRRPSHCGPGKFLYIRRGQTAQVYRVVYLSTLYTHNNVKCIGIIVYVIIRPGKHTWRPLYKHVCEHGDRGDVQESYYPATASVSYCNNILYYYTIRFAVYVVRAKSSTGFVIGRHA